MHSEQKEFLDVVFKKQNSTNKGEKVYQSLVFKVFFDALSSAYPLFYEIVDKKEFNIAIYDFMQFGAKSHVMWKMPNEFRKFVKKKRKFREYAFVDDLLWFEWSEMKLVMKNYKTFNIEEFSYKNYYFFSKSAVLKKLDYRVFEKGSFEKSGDFYLLGFYDFNEYRVLFREISEIMFIFLEELKSHDSNMAISKIANMSGQSKKEVQDFFYDALNELLKKSIIWNKIK